jgi:hypothetical protein
MIVCDDVKWVELISGWRPTAAFGISSAECFGCVREYSYWRHKMLSLLAAT